jgi:hypothetical protein
MKRVLLLIRRLVGLPPAARANTRPRMVFATAVRLHLPPEVSVAPIVERMRSQAEKLYGPRLLLILPDGETVVRSEDRTVMAMARDMRVSPLRTQRDLLSWPEYSREPLDASAVN